MATDYSRLTVLELRQELKQRSLPQTGKKADLVDRLAAFEQEQEQEHEHEQEQEQEQAASEPDNAHNGNNVARDSPSPEVAAEEEQAANKKSPSPAPSATALQPSIAEDVVQAPADNRNLDDASTASAEPLNPTQDSTPTQDPINETETGEPANVELATVTEIVKDAVSRKRRSRSPPPETESSRKRARPSDQAGEGDSPQPLDTAYPPSDDLVDKKAHPEYAHQESLEVQPEPHSQPKEDSNAEAEAVYRRDQEEQHTSMQARDQRQNREASPPTLGERQLDSVDEPMADYDREVAPSLHPATSALYIKNFMRPLREAMLQDYLIELAAFPGDAPDPDCLINFYLDQVRTHSLVRFTSVSAASRVRTALHGIVWPNERNRKELWADFIPDDKVVEWVGREQSEGVRGSSRWEVQYEPDDNGAMTARLVNAETEPVRRNSTRQPLGPPPVPTGPARSSFPVVEGAPLGPRGRGGNRYSQAPPLAPQQQQQGQQSGGGERDDRGWKTTQARPSVSYKPVPAELTQRRLANLKSYITKDRHRNLGAPDEINRYTFEDGDEFVDRGKEAFIGIRPPHRERERRRLGIGRGGNRGGGRAPSPRRPRDEGFYQPSRDDFGRDRGFDRGFERRDDRGFGGRRDDVPRSRFDGQPLPTFSGPGPRGPRRGGGGGGRRDRY